MINTFEESHVLSYEVSVELKAWTRQGYGLSIVQRLISQAFSALSFGVF